VREEEYRDLADELYRVMKAGLDRFEEKLLRRMARLEPGG
jgi:hypothetical protein